MFFRIDSWQFVSDSSYRCEIGSKSNRLISKFSSRKLFLISWTSKTSNLVKYQILSFFELALIRVGHLREFLYRGYGIITRSEIHKIVSGFFFFEIFYSRKLKNRNATRYIMAIYHDQAVQFLINQITRVSDQLKMQKCRTMNHHEKGYRLRLERWTIN